MKRILLLVSALFIGHFGYSQELYWPSPEVEQMHRQANEYLSKGAVKQSIILFQQAIQLAPDVMVLRRDLAKALNISGDHSEAYNNIKPVLESGQADEITYHIAANALMGKDERRKAKRLLEDALKDYPHSGMLFCELGLYHEKNNDLEFALDAWLKGIEADPEYHLNYYYAAKAYAQTKKPVWTIVYGETFANLERFTTRSSEVKALVFTAYKEVYTSGILNNIAKTGEIDKDIQFEDAVLSILQGLAPVVSDGFTTENLTMLRARFIMDWISAFADKYPFTLFVYQDKMLRDGEFDAYNQWFFGSTENKKQYESWIQFHSNALPELEEWISSNKFRPTASDFYNPKDLRLLFIKGKNKG